jgi:prolyl-tRNA synthetase
MRARACTHAQVEAEEYQLRPMNCPFHVAMYKDGFHSYRDLPLRWAELGTVYRCALPPRSACVSVCVCVCVCVRVCVCV